APCARTARVRSTSSRVESYLRPSESIPRRARAAPEGPAWTTQSLFAGAEQRGEAGGQGLVFERETRRLEPVGERPLSPEEHRLRHLPEGRLHREPRERHEGGASERLRERARELAVGDRGRGGEVVRPAAVRMLEQVEDG